MTFRSEAHDALLLQHQWLGEDGRYYVPRALLRYIEDERLGGKPHLVPRHCFCETCTHCMHWEAADAVRWAIYRGQLARQDCQLCGRSQHEPPPPHMQPQYRQFPQAMRRSAIPHHEDYAQPLAVIWYCRPCHGYRHHYGGPVPTDGSTPPGRGRPFDWWLDPDLWPPDAPVRNGVPLPVYPNATPPLLTASRARG